MCVCHVNGSILTAPQKLYEYTHCYINIHMLLKHIDIIIIEQKAEEGTDGHQ